MAFAHESAIVAFAKTEKYGGNPVKTGEYIRSVLDIPDMTVSVSNPFVDLSQALWYYRQACVAAEVGSSEQPTRSVYSFQDMLPRYMLKNSTGIFPLEKLLKEYFSKLIEYEADSTVEYMNTLLVYLSNNMNAKKTADLLYIHRSSLNSRICKIQDLLGLDLNNPDDRMIAWMLLRLRSLQQFERTSFLNSAHGDN